VKELIEAGAVEELTRLKVERDQLRDRLARLESLQEGVDPRVARRVAEDYRKRLTAVDEKAAPLLQRARQAYAALRKRLDELNERHEAIRLDREEIELRHRLGEYDDQQRGQRLAAIEESLAEVQAQRSEGEAIRERFLAAVDAEAELLGAIPAAGPTAAGVAGPITAPVSRPIPASVAAPPNAPAAAPTEAPSAASIAAPAQASWPGVSSTQPIRPPSPPDPALAPTRPIPVSERENRPATGGATVALKPARLVPQTREAGRVPVPLVFRNYRVGSGEDCDIRIGDADVSAHQADILVGTDGFTLTDHAGNGRTRVNGEHVERKLLRDGDAIEFGKARFLFREV
jgi:pSer/pThr/pTyr-binding forkhead associated (FHA) protein/regulator of replication initiation timing